MTKKMGPGVRRGGRVGSGFVSRDNNDETAKNFFEANEVAKLPRKLTVTWNIVPWDLSKDGQKQPPTKADIELGLTYLYRLINLLPRLRAIVLVGTKAQKVERVLRERYDRIRILPMPPPQPP